MYLDLFESTDFSCLPCSSIIECSYYAFFVCFCYFWNTTNCHLFVHYFNNVLRILFAKKELSLLVPLYTYLYLNKTISDKELAGVNPES